MLVQYAANGDSVLLLKFCCFEGDMDSELCLLIKLKCLEEGGSDISEVDISKDEISVTVVDV